MAADTSTEAATLVDFALPSLGSDMDEGTVIEWLVEVGDDVHKGDILLRVDTEKSDIDVEVWHDARVGEILVAPGEKVPVGTTLARLDVAPGPAARAESAPPPPSPPPDAPAPKQTPAAGESPPAIRREDAARTQPAVASGPAHNGAGVVRPDPRMVFWPAPATPTSSPAAPAGAAAGEPARSATSRADRRQAAVAALMERSNREIPHFHLVRRVDMGASLAWLDEHNEAVPPTERILPAALFLYAVARAAGSSPVNGTFDGGPVDACHVDLGVAVHMRGGGLVTPVLPAAETLPLDTMMWELQAMVGRSRAGRMSTRDMTAATLTVTNVGDAGADQVHGVIRPPERALVGIGRISERAVVIDGEVAVRPMVDITLSADHRVVNGHAGARFLDALAGVLARPETVERATDPNPQEDRDDDRLAKAPSADQ